MVGHDPLRSTADLDHVETLAAPGLEGTVTLRGAPHYRSLAAYVHPPWIRRLIDLRRQGVIGTLPKSRLQDSNPPPPAYKAGALPMMS